MVWTADEGVISSEGRRMEVYASRLQEWNGVALVERRGGVHPLLIDEVSHLHAWEQTARACSATGWGKQPFAIGVAYLRNYSPSTFLSGRRGP